MALVYGKIYGIMVSLIRRVMQGTFGTRVFPGDLEITFHAGRDLVCSSKKGTFGT